MKEYIMPMGRLNAIALLMILPIGVVLGIPFGLIHGFEFLTFKNISFKAIMGGSFMVLGLFIVGVLLHEFLHGLTWSFFTQRRWKAISFGIKWEYLTPYCHCDEPLRKVHFVLGAVMPCLVLGLIPVFISYYSGNFRIWFFGFFFTISAGGDLIALWMLRKIPRNAMLQDHPSEMGFILFDEDIGSDKQHL
jgi:hypothetical protein